MITSKIKNMLLTVRYLPVSGIYNIILRLLLTQNNTLLIAFMYFNNYIVIFSANQKGII